MSEIKYYVVYSTGKLNEVDRRTYLSAFNDPYVTLLKVIEESNEWTIEKITEESEHEGFKRISPLGIG